MSEVNVLEIDNSVDLEETVADVFGMNQNDPGLEALSDAMDEWTDAWDAKVEVRESKEYVEVVFRLPK